MPTNIQMAISAITTSVADAFFDSGGRNAGTPFDTASTPVMAVQPLAKAVNSRNVVSFDEPASAGSGTWTCVTCPVTYWYRPARIRTAMLTTKKYVGTAKMRPDSRMPRRFPNIRTARHTRHISTRKTSSFGNADVTARMPAEILTDTVSV